MAVVIFSKLHRVHVRVASYSLRSNSYTMAIKKYKR
jgi:hypothetical protein